MDVLPQGTSVDDDIPQGTGTIQSTPGIPCRGESSSATAKESGTGQDLPRVGLVYDESMTKHRNLDDDEHPEQPARIVRIFERLEEERLVQRCVRLQGRKATREELLLKHTEKHVDTILNVGSLSDTEAMQLGDKYRSVYLCPESAEVAMLSAGSVIESVVQVCEGHVQRAICIVRPPGHHAECDCAMGFCLFANVSLAVAEAQRRGLSHRTLIVDWDVHHGNGTQKLFEDDSAVLYFSIHRYDSGRYFPGGEGGHFTSHGKGEGEGYSVNIPWDVRGGFKKGHPAPGDSEYLEAFRKVLLPVVADFKPDLVVVSAGFDAAAGDPLGECEVTPAGYHELTSMLVNVAGGRVVIVLEGGYNLDAISESMLASARALFEEPMPPSGTSCDSPVEFSPPLAHHFHAGMVERVRAHLSQFWPSLCAEGEEVKVHPAEPRVPAAALRGTHAEMEQALLEHATSESELAKLKHRQEVVLFKLEEMPPDPKHVKAQRGWQVLRDSFESTSCSPPYLVCVLHVMTPEQTISNLGLALQSGASGVILVNSGHAHSPPEAALDPPAIHRATLKGPSGGPSGKAGKAQLDALAECFAAARDAYSEAWLGVSIPQLPPSQVFKWVASHCSSANAVWLHHLSCKAAEVIWETSTGHSGEVKHIAVRVEKWFTDHQPSLKGVIREHQVSTWKGVVIGSLAMADQDRLHHAQEETQMSEACTDLLHHWVAICSNVCDVVATGAASLDGPCSPAKLQAMEGVTPLALICSGHQGEFSAAANIVDMVLADGRAMVGCHQAEEGKLFDFDGAHLKDWIARWRQVGTSTPTV